MFWSFHSLGVPPIDGGFMRLGGGGDQMEVPQIDGWFLLGKIPVKIDDLGGGEEHLGGFSPNRWMV